MTKNYLGKLFLLGLTVTGLLCGSPAQAALTLGTYSVTYCCGTADGPQVDAAANGVSYGGVVNTSNLGGFNIIVAGNYNSNFTNWVANGGALIWHDWSASGAHSLPGMSSVTGVSSGGSNIDVISALSPIVNGPFGTLTNTNMDGGSASNHGFVNLASLVSSDPLVSDITAVLSNGNADQVTEFSYRYGKGLIIYAAMPTDAYTGSSPFVTAGTAGLSMLGKNEVAYAMNFENTSHVPEPASFTLMCLGLAGLGVSRRKAKQP